MFTLNPGHVMLHPGHPHHITLATPCLQLGHPTISAWPSHHITTIAWAYLPGLEAKIFSDRDQFNIDPGPVLVKRSQDLPGLEAKIFNDRDQGPGPVQIKRSQDWPGCNMTCPGFNVYGG